jgi:hypothetical protein
VNGPVGYGWAEILAGWLDGWMAKTDRKGLMEVLYGMIGSVWICATLPDNHESQPNGVFSQEPDRASVGEGHVIMVSTELYFSAPTSVLYEYS